jgi:hypothetical protein
MFTQWAGDKKIGKYLHQQHKVDRDVKKLESGGR